MKNVYRFPNVWSGFWCFLNAVLCDLKFMIYIVSSCLFSNEII